MGDEQSKPFSPEEADSSSSQNVQGRTATSLNAEFYGKNVDGRSAIASAFGDDKVAMEEIERIVQQLEGTETSEQQAERAQKELKSNAAHKAKVAEKKHERVSKDAAKRGGAEADNWLERQLKQGRIEEKQEMARRRVSQQEKTNEPKVSESQNLKEDYVRMSVAAEVSITAETGGSSFRMSQIEDTAGKGAPRVCTWIPLPVKPIAQDCSGILPPVPTPVQKTSKPKKAIPKLYKLLGVGVDATFEEIRKGYRREAMKWHPDKNREKPEEATERFKQISEAFDTLFDPVRREAYDSGQPLIEKKTKKLTGHGWARVEDEDDQCLTPQGFKWKRQSWNTYVFLRGRIDDVDPIIDDPVSDPRVPQEKIKVFWRFIGQKAFEASEDSCSDTWLREFISCVWKDTPSKWPGALELKTMNEVAQQEWKERRMVYNRRKQKVLLNIELHEAYLAIPNRLKKEKERLMKARPDLVGEMRSVD